MSDDYDMAIWIYYENWRGERRWRRVQPVEGGIGFGVNQFHLEPGWLLAMIDLEDPALPVKSFALVGIKGVSKAKPEEAGR